MGRKKFASFEELRESLHDILGRGVLWGYRRLPAGVRTAVGILVMIGGVFGFLPILGFWMIPLGAALIALDIPPIRRRLVAWAEVREDAAGGPTAPPSP